jgi:hypothetical protein
MHEDALDAVKSAHSRWRKDKKFGEVEGRHLDQALYREEDTEGRRARVEKALGIERGEDPFENGFSAAKEEITNRIQNGTWDESKHPRAEDGKFGSGGGGEKAGGMKKPKYGDSEESWRKWWDHIRPEIEDFFASAKNTRELGVLKRRANKKEMVDDRWGFGMLDKVYKEKYDKLVSEGKSMHYVPSASESAAASRMDRLLRTRDSSGKATPRR